MPVEKKAFTKWAKKEVSNFFKTARIAHKSRFITILYKTTQEKNGKILITISKKIGNAVVRNKLRRQIKAIIHEHSLYTMSKSFAMVTKPPITSLSFQELETLVVTACTKK